MQLTEEQMTEVIKNTPPIQQKQDDQHPNNSLSCEKSKGTLDELIVAAKLRGVPESFAKKYQIGDDFNLETALSELDTEWIELKQLALNESVETVKVRKGITGSANATSKKELDAVMERIM